MHSQPLDFSKVVNIPSLGYFLMVALSVELL